jgi:hypothetical protein
VTTPFASNMARAFQPVAAVWPIDQSGMRFRAHEDRKEIRSRFTRWKACATFEPSPSLPSHDRS